MITNELATLLTVIRGSATPLLDRALADGIAVVTRCITHHAAATDSPDMLFKTA
jgi:hypothetical protein